MGMDRLKGRSLSDMMWLMIGGTLLLFGVVFVACALIITSNSRREYEIRETETTIHNMVDSIDAEVSNYKDISRLIMLNDGVMSYLRSDSVDIWSRNRAIDGIMAMLNVCDSMDSVFVFRNDGAYTSTGKGRYDIDLEKMAEDSWRHAINDHRGGAIVALNGNDAVFRHDGTDIVTIARAVYDIYSQKQTGILLMNLSENMLMRIAQAQTDSEVCILSPDGELLAGSSELAALYDPAGLADTITHSRERLGNQKRTVSVYAPKDYPFILMCAARGNTFMLPKNFILVLVALLLVFLISVLYSGWLVTRNLTRPILSLAGAIEQTKSSGWLKPIDVEMPPNELGVLSDSYNSMIEYLNDLFRRQIENEKAVQQAEVRVLYEQIKPHFLYNSLGTIGCMALEAGADDVHDALETLGSFYRNFLSKGEREIPLRRELSIIRDYLALQKLRYGDIFEDEYDIEERTLDYCIPKLILQPLVENCINHGIRLKGEPGVIRIRSRLEDGLLRLAVYDSGVGMDEAQIADVLSGNEVIRPGDHGFGLSGTIKRIRYYSDRADVVQIHSEPGEFTEIEFTVPLMKKEGSSNV